MTPNSDQQQQANGTNSWIWAAGAVGTAAGVAALVYSRSRRSPWERAAQRIARGAEAAREEVKPWMGLAAGAVAGTAALAYGLSRKPSGWEQARRNTKRFATQTGKELQPWLALAASTAISLASAASRRSERAHHAGGRAVADSAAKLASTGMDLWRRVQRISGETGKLVPRVRSLIA